MTSEASKQGMRVRVSLQWGLCCILCFAQEVEDSTCNINGIYRSKNEDNQIWKLHARHIPSLCGDSYASYK